jgi:hypothetical protein
MKTFNVRNQQHYSSAGFGNGPGGCLLVIIHGVAWKDS